MLHVDMECKNEELFKSSKLLPHNVYLIFRKFWCIYFFSLCIFEVIYNYNAYWVIYFTNWMIVLSFMGTLFQLLVCTDIKVNLKLVWFFSNIIENLHIFITLFYWCLIYPYFFSHITLRNASKHIIPVVYTLINSIVSNIPKRIFHCYQAIIILAIYVTFSIIYYIMGGLNEYGHIQIYPLLDWSTPIDTLVIFAGVIFIIIPIIHLGLCGIHVLVNKLYVLKNKSRNITSRYYE